MPLRTSYDYLKRWRFTPQKPVKRACEQNPKKVMHWLETIYLGIAVRAKQEKAEIHWGDETGIHKDAYNAKGLSSKGTASVVRLNVKNRK